MTRGGEIAVQPLEAHANPLGGHPGLRAVRGQAGPGGRHIDPGARRQRDAAVEAAVELREARNPALVEQVLDLGQAEPADPANQLADPR